VSSPKWSEREIGDQSGRVALVTGANSGIGFGGRSGRGGSPPGTIAWTRQPALHRRGPYSRFQNSGSASKVSRARRAYDDRAALRLWELWTAATGADYRVLDAPLSRGRLA